MPVRLHCAVLYCTVLHCTVLLCIVLLCTVPALHSSCWRPLHPLSQGDRQHADQHRIHIPVQRDEGNKTQNKDKMSKGVEEADEGETDGMDEWAGSVIEKVELRRLALELRVVGTESVCIKIVLMAFSLSYY